MRLEDRDADLPLLIDKTELTPYKCHSTTNISQVI